MINLAIPITVLVQTKNEEKGIANCLRALGDFSEVIVVDSLSTDRTVQISKELGYRVVDFCWNGRYPKKKQWQLENIETKNHWILFLDADEAPSVVLLNEISRIFSQGVVDNDVAAFDVQLDYCFSGRLLRHGHRVVKRCLVNRDRAAYPVVDDLDLPGMGELEGHYQPVADGRVGRLVGRLIHDDQDPVRTWFDRHNRYSDWEAHLRASPDARGAVAKSRSRQGSLFDRVPCKPLAFFAYSYIARLGFLDGRAGFDYAFGLAAYYWQIGLKCRELARSSQP